MDHIFMHIKCENISDTESGFMSGYLRHPKRLWGLRKAT
jgi:hypothetical protein